MLVKNAFSIWQQILIVLLCNVGSIGVAHAQVNTATCQAIIADTNSAMGGDRRAVNILRGLAAKGNSLAQVLLADVISDQNYSYQWYTVGAFSKDHKSIFYAKEAADNGNHLGQAMYGFMSLMMAHSYPIKDKNAVIARGYRYLKKGIPDIKRHLQGPCASPYLDALAGLSFYGWGVPRNMKNVLRLELRAAQAGLVPAIGAVGTIYALKNAPFRNQTKAVEWTRRAANDGYLPSMTLLGFIYAHGEGIKKSYAKAFELYKRAADRGYPPAKYYLSLAYFDGRGTPVNWKKARSLMAQAMVYKPADSATLNEMLYSEHSIIKLRSPTFIAMLRRDRKAIASFRRFENENGLKPIKLFDAG